MIETGSLKNVVILIQTILSFVLSRKISIFQTNLCGMKLFSIIFLYCYMVFLVIERYLLLEFKVLNSFL